MIAIRRNHKSFGRGTLRFLYPANRKVLAYIRCADEECVLCVVNLSRSPQAVELDLSEYKGATPIEMSGGSAFPPIGDLPYLLTLPAYGFYWFDLSTVPVERPAPPQQQPLAPELFTLVLTGGPETIFLGRERAAFERTIIPRFVETRRWFAGRGSTLASTRLVDFAVLKNRIGPDGFLFPIVRATMKSGEERDYSAPLALEEKGEPEELLPFAIARVRRGPRVGLLYGAASSAGFALSIVDALRRKDEIAAHDGGTLCFEGGDGLSEIDDPEAGEVRRLTGEQSNTSITIGPKMILKLYRQLQTGVHPEVEVGRFLTEVAGYRNTPALLGSVVYRGADGGRTAIAVLQQFVQNQGDAWSRTVETLKRELDAAALMTEGGAEHLQEALADHRPLVRILGQRTAELHLAFATATDDPAFAVEPFTAEDMRLAAADAKAQGARAFAALDRFLPGAQDGARVAIEALLARREECGALIAGLAAAPVPGAVKTRVHGDFHLGQVLIAQSDVMLVDFEGEPSRPVEERRAKSSPLRDVAGMLRSFAYASETAARDVGQRFVGSDTARVTALAETARRFGETNFLESYEATVRGTPVFVEDEAGRRDLLRLHLLGKALYEINYEADHRPDWIETPVRGVLSLLDEAGASP
jgi:maltose alpha-D-glucosyltransferase/alpha-amylase